MRNILIVLLLLMAIPQPISAECTKGKYWWSRMMLTNERSCKTAYDVTVRNKLLKDEELLGSFYVAGIMSSCGYKEYSHDAILITSKAAYERLKQEKTSLSEECQSDFDKEIFGSILTFSQAYILGIKSSFDEFTPRNYIVRPYCEKVLNEYKQEIQKNNKASDLPANGTKPLF